MDSALAEAMGIVQRLATEMPKPCTKRLQIEDEIAASPPQSVRTLQAPAPRPQPPGLALLAEMFGLSVMAEVAAVVIVSQHGGLGPVCRPDPEPDLNTAVDNGSGDAQRIALP